MLLGGGIYSSDLGNLECIDNINIIEVRGRSLEPLINNRDEIQLLNNFYDCNPTKKEDIVIYNFVGNEQPLIKLIKGVEGDSFVLVKSKNDWNILINGEVVKNSEGLPYRLGTKAYRMLHLYEEDYNKKIPEHTVLLLGNEPSGSLDATKFGIVDKKDIIGKAILIE